MNRASPPHLARAAIAGALFVTPLAALVGVIQSGLLLSAHDYAGAGLGHLAWFVHRELLLAGGIAIVAAIPVLVWLARRDPRQPTR